MLSMTIALFGGRFDPVHNGHIHVAKAVLKAGKAEEVWFVPDNTHQWNPIIASPQDRLNMLKLVLESDMKVDDAAIRLGGMSETIYVYRRFRQKYPSIRFIFICGSDQLPTLRDWTYWTEIEQEIPFLVVAREGYPITDLPSNCTLLEDPAYIPVEDSATRIRKLIKERRSITDLVSSQINSYIKSHNLYI